MVRATSGSRNGAISEALLATNAFHATEASWRAISSIASRQVPGSVCSPPTERGSNSRNSRDACSCDSSGAGMRRVLLDRIGRGGDGRPEIAGRCERVRTVLGIHAPPLG